MIRRKAPDPHAPCARALALTRAAMVAERAARAFWLPASMALIAVAAMRFDLFAHISPLWGFWLGAGFALVFLVALGVGLWRFHWPSRAEAVARLDLTLPGRPLAALADAQAIGAQDSESVALWQAHRARMAAAAASARPVPPAPRLARRDPYALRLIALTAVALALLFGAPQRVGELPGMPSPAGAAISPVWEGWITPPAYTGRPALYLNEIRQNDFDVPQGSRVVLRFYGPPGAHHLGQTIAEEVSTEEESQTLEFAAMQSGRLSIIGPSSRSWFVQVLPDEAPRIRFDGQMRRGRGGVMEQPFLAEDDYGVTGGTATIELNLAAVERRHGLAREPEPREALELDLPLPMTASRARFSDVLREDLSEHPWAHLPVRISLSVRDAAGQEGQGGERREVLPARRFFEPGAMAVAELRRDLLWHRDNARRAARLMRAMLHRPDGAFRDEEIPERLRGAVDFIEARLENGRWDGAARDEVANEMWDLALLMEEGELANARERLRRARERLEQAMRDGASDDEIAELMDELREATRDYMRMLAEQPRERGEAGGGESLDITGDQIRELMDRIQELMEEGRMDEAAELMARLQELLENLQVTEGEGGEPMPGSEAMEGLGDTLSDQQGLADETFRELQQQFGGRGLPAPGDEPGEGEGEGRLDGLAERQEALRERLREQQLQALPGEGTPEGDAALDALEEAERAMDEAARALRDGDARDALERQAEALEQLREGLRQMNDAMRADRDERAGERDRAEGEGTGRDPLGRDRRGEADTGGDLGALEHGGDPRARARELMDEIRRRSGELERPEDERDYLNRLIERF